MLGLRLNLPGTTLLRTGGGAPSLPPTPAPSPTPTPPPAIGGIVIEGDSITFAGGSGGFAWQYAAAPPSGTTATVRSQNSRVVAFSLLDQNGEPVYFVDGDGQNSLLSHVTEDVATHGGQLIASMIGANDMAVARTASQYRSDLAIYWARVKAKGAMFAWSPPLPYNSNQSHGSYANFTAQRAALMATARDPATWGQFADFYIPLGEHVDFAAVDNSALYGDGVHPNQAGQNALYPVFKAAMDTLLDTTRASSTAMYAAAWPSSETGLATSTQIVRRLVVKGIAHAGLASGVAISGGGAQVRLNGGAWGSGIGRIYNGDTIELRITTSGSHLTAASADLTIGSETRTLSFTTGANVSPAVLANGQLIDFPQSGAGATRTAEVAFPATGLGIVAISCYAPTAPDVTYKGVACTPIGGQYGGGVYRAVWLYSVPVADTTGGTLAVTFPFVQQLMIAWIGTLQNVDGTPLSAPTPANSAANNPVWSTGSAMVPAGGIMLGFLATPGGSSTPVPTVTSGALVAAGFGSLYQSQREGIGVGARSTTGSITFDWNSYGDNVVAAVIFKAAGS